MRLLIFLHGTTIMHKGGENCLREERVKQVQLNEPSVKDYDSYIPIENAPQKIKTWANQGAEIAYLSSHKIPTDLKKDELVLKKYQFPKGEIYIRQGEETYADVAERVMPDILIEDN